MMIPGITETAVSTPARRTSELTAIRQNVTFQSISNMLDECRVGRLHMDEYRPCVCSRRASGWCDRRHQAE